MRAIRTYESLLAGLGDIFYPKYQESGIDVRMLGLIFARPESNLGKSVKTDRGRYWHFRSGEYIDFFWPGYDDDWSFDAELFNEFRSKFESETRWRYSGGSELILLDARYDPHYRSNSCPFGRGVLDFTTAICIDLDVLERRRGEFSIDKLFEEIFRAAEKGLGTRPTKRFSQKAGLTSAGKALWNTVIGFLPKPIQGLVSGDQELIIARNIGR